MADDRTVRIHERWAHFRFSVVGPLLAAPPGSGELRGELKQLSEKTWTHPVSGKPVTFSVSTIERWFYLAKRARTDPVGALKKKIRADKGKSGAMGEKLKPILFAQYREHRSWTCQLHYDNLKAAVEADADLGPLPSYHTVRRFLKSQGLFRQRRFPDTPGGRRARARLDDREVRSFEAEYVNGLWHLDFHHGSRRVLLPRGAWATPLEPAP